MSPDDIAKLVANGSADGGDWEEDMEGDRWTKLWRLHTMICDGVLQTHDELSKWNDADAEGK